MDNSIIADYYEPLLTDNHFIPADAITDPADFMVAPLIGNILVMIQQNLLH